MKKSENKTEGSKPIYKITTKNDVYIRMRDGVRLAADIIA